MALSRRSAGSTAAALLLLVVEEMFLRGAERGLLAAPVEEDEEAEAEDEVKARRRSDGAGDVLAVNPAMAIRLPLERVVMTMECWWNGKVG